MSTQISMLLIHAVTKNVLEHLIQRGANVDIVDITGNTPLHHAILQKNFEKMQILVKYKANVNIRNNTGETPLHMAVYDGTIIFANKAIPLLLNNGADGNISITPNGTAAEKISQSRQNRRY